MEFKTFRELADQIGVGIDTVRRTVRKLELAVLKEKTPTSKGATVHCLSLDDGGSGHDSSRLEITLMATVSQSRRSRSAKRRGHS